MSLRYLRALIALLAFTATAPALAQPSFGTSDEYRAVSTFHSIGVYWAPPGKAASAIAEIRYKVAGAPDSEYRRGLDLWYDVRNGEYRGSIVYLQPGTAYDIRLTLSSGLVRNFAATAGSTTWSETFNGEIIDFNDFLPTSGMPKLALQGAAHSGSPGNWKIYTAPAGANNTINQEGFSNTDSCITLDNVSYVVIRGLNISGCKLHGIHLFGGSHHVVIEDNDISNWGRLTSGGVPEGNGGVFCRDAATSNKVRNVVVQKNSFHDPRHGSSPWGPFQIHPEGPLAVRFLKCGSNHVIRYNDVFASSGHYFKDGFGGANNFGDDSGEPDQGGFPWADSDIYGNRIQNVYDDAIESEGDDRNVRVWRTTPTRSSP
jgi:hypothetical protein